MKIEPTSVEGDGNRDRPLRVEMIGLPGSGKSHFVPHLAASLGLRRIDDPGRIKKICLCLVYALRHPALGVHLMRCCMRQSRGNAALFHRKFRYLCRAFAREQAADRQQRAILDEGLFQFLLSLYEDEISERDLSLFLRHVPRDYRHVVIVTAPAFRRHERMTARSRMPRRLFGVDYVIRWQSVMTRNFATLEGFIERQYPHSRVAN